MVAFDPAYLTDYEQILILKTWLGEIADFKLVGSRPSIRALLLRHILLELPIPNFPSPVLRMSGLRIRNAKIEGVLDLSGLATPGHGLPTVLLESCDIPNCINLQGARIASLSIRDSHFTHIFMRDVDIDGPLDISGVSPCANSGADDNSAWIDARGCSIHGQLMASGAHLRAPLPRAPQEIRVGEKRFALRLTDSSIGGSIFLTDGFVAEGGVSLGAAQVHGDVWADGARLTAGEGDALYAQVAKIEGSLWLARGFRAFGEIWLQGAHIGAALHVQDAVLQSPSWCSNQGKKNSTCWLSKGSANLNESSGKALVAERARIGTTVFLGPRLRIYGIISFTGANIGGNVQCSKIRVLTAKKGVDPRLGLENAHVGGDFLFEKSVVLGAVALCGARVGGDFRLDGGRLGNRQSISDAEALALDGQRSRIDGSVYFGQTFRSFGAVLLTGATVGLELKCQGAIFKHPKRSAFYAKDIQIGSDLRFQYKTRFDRSSNPTIMDGDLRLERACIGGSLEWDGLQVCRKRATLNGPPSLDLRHAKVGSALKALDLLCRDRSIVNLSGMTASTVAGNWSRGWGGNVENHVGRFCDVILDGFIYERLVPDHSESLSTSLTGWSRFLNRLRRIACFLIPCHSKRASELVAWLNGRTADALTPGYEFFPQPYRQLAKVLRAQGEEDVAREVMIAEQWAAPKTTVAARTLRFAFGALFGFGLRPMRATAVLMFWIAVGALGIHAARENHLLVESIIVTHSADQVPISGVVPVGILSESPNLDPACVHAADGWLDDVIFAADMLLPFIPLHQETKCEIKPGADVSLERFFKAIYTIIGWVIASVSLLTFSGVLRRLDRDSG